MQLLNASTFYYPGALGEDGRVGGYVRRSSTQSPFDVPVIWNLNGAPSALPMGIAFDQAGIVGISRNGVPLGNASIGDSFPAGYWTPSGFESLPAPGAGGTAFAGNGSVIVGLTYDPTFGERATIWNAHGYQVLPNLQGSSSRCMSINVSGIYVGTGQHGFIGQDGTAEPLRYPSFAQPYPFEINDSNFFTGVWFPQPGQLIRRGFVARAFSDEIYDLGVLPGYVESYIGGINNDNTIVGAARNSGDYEKALIWLNGSLVPQDLNLMVDLPEATLIRAIDVNNAGQILVEARLDAGGFAYYRLDPIPEPSAVAGAISAVLTLSHRGRRRGR